MAYNKLKAHQYYMKHRKLKGRKRKTGLAGAGFGGSTSIKGLVAKPTSGSKPASGSKTKTWSELKSDTGVGIAGSRFGSKSAIKSLSDVKSASSKKKKKKSKRSKKR